MARKNRPILYEVAKRQQKSQSPVRPVNRPVTPERAEKPVEPPAPPPKPQTPPPPTPPNAAGADARPSPLAGGPLKTEQDKSTNLPSFEPNSRLQIWVLGGAGAVVLLFIAFAIGQGLWEPTRPTLPPLPEENTTEGGQEQVVADPDPEPQQDNNVVYLPSGYHYVVVQHFPKRKFSDAEKAWAFLAENGVECAVMEKADIMLVVTQRFESPNDPGVRALLARIKKLGEEYRLNGYNFGHAKLMKFK